MTIKIILECDAGGCGDETELRDYTDADVERAGWGIDHAEGFHYCPTHWPIVQKGIADDQAV